MVQSMPASTLAISRYGGCFGSFPVWRKPFGLMKESQMSFGVGKQNLWHHFSQSLLFIGQSDLGGCRNVRVNVGWPFKGNNQGLNAASERSDSANEDILMFFFQLDLATRVQYALNLEQYDIAKQLRDKLNEVEEEVIRQQETRKGTTSKSEVQDMAISILRLKADLQNAIESENYSLAAELRDEISKIESESLAASVKAQVYQNAQYAFHLGQKVRHKTFEYRAVICGMDPVCCETKSWMETANVYKLTRGPDQPFYQVLVDVYMDPNLLVAYVPEENLCAPDKPDMERFDHPYASFLFYGTDAAGDFIPIKQLREKYNRPRHEIPYDPDNEQNGDDI
nr:clp protease adapter protein ClpF, chloroplastic-like isoform X2 [Coffea arabica]